MVENFSVGVVYVVVIVGIQNLGVREVLHLNAIYHFNSPIISVLYDKMSV